MVGVVPDTLYDAAHDLLARLTATGPVPSLHPPVAGAPVPVTSPVWSITEPFLAGRLAPGQPGVLPRSGPVPSAAEPLASVVGGAQRQARPLPTAPAQRSIRPGPAGGDAARPGTRNAHHDRGCRAAARCALRTRMPAPTAPFIPTPPVPGSSLPDPSLRAPAGSTAASPAAPTSVPGVRSGTRVLRAPAVAFADGVCQRAEDPSFSPD